MKVILLDVETTGVNPKVNEITQIGFTVLDDNMIVEEVYDELVGIENEENYSIDAMVVSQITPEDIRNKPKLENNKIYQRLKKLDTPDNFLIAHNASFDCSFLQKYNLAKNMKVIDTLKLSRILITETPKHTLQYLRYFLKLYRTTKNLSEVKCFLSESKDFSAHDAISDVVYLKDLLDYLMETYNLSLEELMELQDQKVEIVRMPFGKYKNIRIEDVAASDRGYLQWVVEQTKIDKDLKRAVLDVLRK